MPLNIYPNASLLQKILYRRPVFLLPQMYYRMKRFVSEHHERLSVLIIRDMDSILAVCLR